VWARRTAFGRQQKEQHLAATLRGEELWCQLWSEPESRSDLANVRTHATSIADGPGSVNGHKIWTSMRTLRLCNPLCRTDPDAPNTVG